MEIQEISKNSKKDLKYQSDATRFCKVYFFKKTNGYFF